MARPFRTALNCVHPLPWDCSTTGQNRVGHSREGDSPMLALPAVSAEEAGFDPTQLQRAYVLLERWVESDRVPAATLCVGRRGRLVEPRFFGRRRPESGAPALARDALFLLASITKPITVTAVMILVERGQIALHDKVTKYVPPFSANGKEDRK